MGNENAIDPKKDWLNDDPDAFIKEDIKERNHISVNKNHMNCGDVKPGEKHGMGAKFAHITKVHPCYNEKLHDKVGRVHVPIAPKCNIGCNFCIRSINGDENRPGVAGEILSADEAVAHVNEVSSTDLPIAVVGVAGPGDSLANDATFEFFEKISKENPDLIKCMSTNGLLLPKYAERVAELGIDTLTVTVNAVDPEIGKDVYGFIYYEGKLYIETNNQKKVYRQLSKNGKVEICDMYEGKWIRIEGAMKEIGRAHV